MYHMLVCHRERSTRSSDAMLKIKQVATQKIATLVRAYW
jgi:hypothetical protein